MAEYLATLDEAAFGAATPVEPKLVSPVDPAARWTAFWDGPAIFAYCTNDLVDVENAIIVDVEATTALRQAEVGAALPCRSGSLRVSMWLFSKLSRQGARPTGRFEAG